MTCYRRQSHQTTSDSLANVSQSLDIETYHRYSITIVTTFNAKSHTYPEVWHSLNNTNTNESDGRATEFDEKGVLSKFFIVQEDG